MNYAHLSLVAVFVTVGLFSVASAQEDDASGFDFDTMDDITHCSDPQPNPTLIADPAFPAVEPPRCSFNHHGQIEVIGDGVEAVHYFAEADDVTWHFVTAGDPANPTIVFIHGLPDTWFTWHNQIAALSDEYYIVALDQMGYGQTEKSLNLDFSHPSMAQKMTAFLDEIGVDQFHMVGHDRGSVSGDYLLNELGMDARVLTYVRMQQSFNEPHGEPRPPHDVFGTARGVVLFRSSQTIAGSYTVEGGYVATEIPQEEYDRLEYEFAIEGTAEAVSQYFHTTNFDIEEDDRYDFLFKRMSMPVLILQGALDPGQRPEEYENSLDFLMNPNSQVVILETAAHFPQSELPDEVSDNIRSFIQANS